MNPGLINTVFTRLPITLTFYPGGENNWSSGDLVFRSSVHGQQGVLHVAQAQQEGAQPGRQKGDPAPVQVQVSLLVLTTEAPEFLCVHTNG